MLYRSEAYSKFQEVLCIWFHLAAVRVKHILLAVATDAVCMHHAGLAVHEQS